MILQQISVFVENKDGQMAEFIKVLAKYGIDLQALSIAETKDYGILRIIVDDAEKADKALIQEGWVHTLTPVLAATVADAPGSLEKILSVLAEANIGIEYTYAFFSRVQGHACIVLRVADNAAAEKVLADAGIQID